MEGKEGELKFLLANTALLSRYEKKKSLIRRQS
jgi:hypothetical protein